MWSPDKTVNRTFCVPEFGHTKFPFFLGIFFLRGGKVRNLNLMGKKDKNKDTKKQKQKSKCSSPFCTNFSTSTLCKSCKQRGRALKVVIPDPPKPCTGVTDPELIKFFNYYWKTEMYSNNNLVAVSRSGNIEIIGCSKSVRKAEICSSCYFVKDKIARKFELCKSELIVAHEDLPEYFQVKIHQLNAKVQQCELALQQSQQTVHELVEKNFELRKQKHPLSFLLDAVLKKEPEYDQSFNAHFVKTQFECILNNDGRAVEWSDTMKHFSSSIMFYGGERTLQFLRGMAYQHQGRHGSLGIDLKKVNMFLPAPSTLQSCHPHVEIYPGIDFEPLKDIDPLQRVGGIHADEMDIRDGLVLEPKTNSVIGAVNGVLDAKEAMTFLEQNKEPDKILATKVLQLFYVSIDGSVILPIGYIPTQSVDSDQMADIMK
jgi:hypothetical protein